MKMKAKVSSNFVELHLTKNIYYILINNINLFNVVTITKIQHTLNKKWLFEHGTHLTYSINKGFKTDFYISLYMQNIINI